MSEFLSAYFKREHSRLLELISDGARGAFLDAAVQLRLEHLYDLVQLQSAQFEADARNDYALIAQA
jgi:hypothetical protein